MTELDRVTAVTASRAAIQLEWVAALREAAKGHTLAEVASCAGVTRARVSQIVGPVGRPAGRPSRRVSDEAVIVARLAVLDARWDRFIDVLKDRFMPIEEVRRSEQSFRNAENGRAARQASGRTRAGKLSGASGRKSRVRPTVTAEARRFATEYALKFLEDNPVEPVCVQAVRELDEAAALREKLASLVDSRVPFLHD